MFHAPQVRRLLSILRKDKCRQASPVNKVFPAPIHVRIVIYLAKASKTVEYACMEVRLCTYNIHCDLVWQ